MTTSTPTKAIPNPALLVFGKPTSPDLPQASWFRAEDRPTVIAAAQSLKFSVLDIQTDAEKALTLGVHEGVLKGNGRMIVGSVTSDVYKRIEEYAAKAGGATASKTSDERAIDAKPESEKNTNLDDKGAAMPTTVKVAPTAPDGRTDATTTIAGSGSGKPEPAPARDPWDAVRIGSYVIGKYWDGEGEAIGWWLGTITDIAGKDFYIRWPDEPLKPALKIERKHIAILHPSYDVSREWDRKR